MGTVYEDADADTLTFAAGVLKASRPELVDAGVTIRYLFAFREDEQAALKHHGYPAAAIIKINSYDLRKQGLADATLKIDGQQWKDMPERTREALLVHEFLHLELMKNEYGIKLDDCGRPKLKIKLHDIQLGAFEAVLKQFGKDSLDAQALDEVYSRDVVQGVLEGFG